MSQQIPACPPHVKAAFDVIPTKQRKVLLALRKLILQTHRDTPKVGLLVEDLRWGQPSYLTEKPRSGSTIRLGLNREKQPALFFHCGTSLVGEFRRKYAGEFEYEGNRALIIGADSGLVEIRDQLKDCIREAMTYHNR